jgi:hypothetical protein
VKLIIKRGLPLPGYYDLISKTKSNISNCFFRNPGEDEGFGILSDDFFTVRHDWKLEQLQEIMPILTK